MAYIYLFCSIIIAVIGQTLFKIGTESHTVQGETFWKIFSNPSIFFGLGLYFLSALIYIQALKTIPLSIAYPSLSLSYVAVVLIGVILFDETFHRIQIIGLLLIISGVILMGVKR